jgi:hypothetical protein
MPKRMPVPEVASYLVCSNAGYRYHYIELIDAMPQLRDTRAAIYSSRRDPPYVITGMRLRYRYMYSTTAVDPTPVARAI